MGSECKEYSLTELYTVRSGLSKPAKYFGKGYPFLSFKDVFYNYFLPSDLTQLVRSNDKERHNCSIKRGDVFLTRTSETMGELGMSCVAKKDYQDATFNGFCKRLRPSTNTPLHPEYVGYFLRSPQFRNEITAFSTMSTRASLNNDMIKRLRIKLPPLPEQKAIAHILGSLDDKIELNKRMNAMLEGMAQALFKSWFVDFDPVIDNSIVAGNPIPEEFAKRGAIRRKALADNTANRETAKNFPSSFQLTEVMGWIPEGWEVKPIAEQVRLTMGQSPSSVYYNNEGKGLPFHQGVSNYGTRFPHHKQYSTGGSRYAEKGDILFSVRAPVGRINISNCRVIIGRGLSALRHRRNFQGFLGYFLRHTFKEEDSIGSGTIFNAVTKREMESIPFIDPKDELTSTFNHIATSFDRIIAENAVQTLTLSDLRDTLLPKLISGEICIPQTKQIQEEIALHD